MNRRGIWLPGCLMVVALTALVSGAPDEDADPIAPTARNSEVPVVDAAPGSPVIGELIFSHNMHTDDLELECTECHHETHAKALNISHEWYFEDFWIDCQLCHNTAAAQEPQSCSNCHHSHLEDIADETRSAKVVLHQSCWSCHEVGTGATAAERCSMCHSNAGEEP